MYSSTINSSKNYINLSVVIPPCSYNLYPIIPVEDIDVYFLNTLLLFDVKIQDLGETIVF
jgi:hypothetical protein